MKRTVGLLTAALDPRLEHDPDMPDFRKGTKQSAVSFTPGRHPLLSWKATSGYKICGVLADVSLCSAKKPGILVVGQVAYPSGTTSGSTSQASDGRESLKVKIPKDEGRDLAGQTAGIYEAYDVAVYVKKG